MKEIVLPVKCSTMRRWYKNLDDITNWELVAIASLCFISAVVDVWELARGIPAGVYFANIGFGDAILGCILLVVRVAIVLMIAADLSDWVLARLPAIRCTEDEPDYQGELKKEDSQ